MLSRILAFSLIVAIPAYADDCSPTVIDPNVVKDLASVAKKMKIDCPNQVNVNDLCFAVSEHLAETDISQGTKFAYQTKIYKAACVESGDTPDIIQAKIQNFWNKYHDSLTCNELNSSIRQADILKLAVDRSSNDFINDTVRRWKVNLNHVDTDGKTVLDFIADEKQKAQGTPRESIMNRYFQLFQTNGAKFSRDIRNI